MKNFAKILKFLIKIHLLGLLMLTVLRAGLFLTYASSHEEALPADAKLLLTGFVRGVWFDNVIACYLLALPLVLLFLGCIFGITNRRLISFITRYLQIMWGIVLFVSAADIPYFNYFFKHLSSSIWSTFDDGATNFRMIFGEWSYYPPLIAVIVLIFLFVILTNRFKNKIIDKILSFSSLVECIAGSFLLLCLMGLCIIGIRGRFGYNPIKVSAAYYCDNAFLNQLAVPPAFNLITSTLDTFRPENAELHLMDTDEALQNVACWYDWDKILEADTTKTVHSDGQKNVVLILMESMSADLMATFGNKDDLTPFLDSLAKQSLLFTRCYSAGVHTNQGIFSTLYSFPALMGRNMMKGTNIPHYEGLPTELRKHGYRTMFFMTHESQYDNMNAFLRTNGYGEIYAQEDYPSGKIVNSFGVQDDYLFSYALDKIGSSAPFFATLLTISNHPPYMIPKWFQAKHTEDDEKAIVEYSDNSIRQFFASAREQKWFKNTIFVLLGDHGKLMGKTTTEMPESYNHIPLIIFGNGIRPEKINTYATQMDIQRTLLNLLGIKSAQKNFSLDLLRTKRTCAVYTTDDMMGARADSHFYVYCPSRKQEFMYYNDKLTTQNDSVFSHLRSVLFSHLQAMQSIVKKHE